MRSSAWLSLLFSILLPTAFAQSSPPLSAASPTNPEEGFISQSRYTNAFFGFSLPLPRDLTFRGYRLSFKSELSRYFLFGVQTITTAAIGPLRPKLNLFFVTAKKSADPGDLQKAASGPKEVTPTRTEIAGREFWKSEVEEKVPEGTAHHVTFSTEVQGYILQFSIESFDKKVTAKLRDSVSHIQFFDPANARSIAGPESRPYSPRSGSPPPN
jgi:hypothetical protein